jgi:hypothetical protein
MIQARDNGNVSENAKTKNCSSCLIDTIRIRFFMYLQLGKRKRDVGLNTLDHPRRVWNLRPSD